MKRYSLTKYLFLLFLVNLTFVLNSQITIGTGTSNSEKYPLNGYYNYSWSQSIYLANEINSSGNLTSIALYVDNSPSNYTMTNQKIYVRHTASSSISNSNYEDVSGFTLVFDGSITFNGSGWKVINLDIPFNYNGSDNLEFKFENRDGSYTSGFPYFRYSFTPSGTINHRSKYDYKDADFPVNCLYCKTDRVLPNIQMTFQPCNLNAGVLSSTLNIVNPGQNSTLSISGQDPSTTLQWESSIDNVVYKPISGANSNTLTESLYQTKYYRVKVGDGSCFKFTPTQTITVDVSGLITKTIGTIGSNSSLNFPFNNLQKYNWSNFIYQASDISESGNLTRISFNVTNSPDKYSFDNQKIYVRHTTESNFTSKNYPSTSGFTLVYDGAITYEGSGWKEMVFDVPFDYNGVDNLEFLFENRAGSMIIDVARFSYEPIGGLGQTLRRDYGDIFPSTCNTCEDYSFRPNIKMAFIPCELNAGNILAQDTTFCDSGSTVLTLSGNDTGSIIQWQSSTDNVNFNDIVGETSTTLNTGLLNQSKYFRCKVIGNGCTLSTPSQLISISSVPNTIISSSSTSVLLGETVVLTSEGQDPGATLQWYSSIDNTSYLPISGATNNTYSTSTLTSTTSFKLIQTIGSCSDTSNIIQVSVSPNSLSIVTLDGGISETNKFPINGYYNYSWSSVIYKSNEINLSGELKRLSFYLNNILTNEVMYNQKIYVRHTNLNEFDDGLYPGTSDFTLVYDGDITFNGSGWNEIVLQNSFNYNGYENLEVLIENRDGNYSFYNHPKFKVQSDFSEYRVKRAYSDGSFPSSSGTRVNYFVDVQFKFLPCEEQVPVLSAADISVSIGADVELEVTNFENGSSIFWQKSIDGISYETIIGETSNTLVGKMGITDQFYRVLSNLYCTSVSNTITINSNDCFVQIDTIGSGSNTSESILFNGFYDYNWSNIIYSSEDLDIEACKIASISVDVANSPSNFVMHDQKVYIRQTSENVFTSTSYPTTAGFTLVYEGDLTFNGSGWKEIPFDVLFDYDGISSIELLIENHDGGYAYGFPTFNYSVISTGQLKRKHQDDIFPTTSGLIYSYVPNIQFKSILSVAPEIFASSNEVCSGEEALLSIGNQLQGATYQWQNSGDGVLFSDIHGANSIFYNTGGLQNNSFYRLKYIMDECNLISNEIEISINCATKISVNNETGKGVAIVDLSEVNDKVGPYHYYLTSNKLPEFDDIYRYYRDTIGDTLVDSLSFYLNGINTPSYTFDNINPGRSYSTVYDSRGVKVLEQEIYVPKIIVPLYNDGFEIEKSFLTSTKDNAVVIFDQLIGKGSKNGLETTIYNSEKLNYYGLQNINVSGDNSADLKYGFVLENQMLYTIENGVKSNLPLEVDINNSMKLAIIQNDLTLDLSLNNRIVRSIEKIRTDEVFYHKININNGGIVHGDEEVLHVDEWDNQIEQEPYKIGVDIVSTTFFSECFDNKGVISGDVIARDCDIRNVEFLLFDEYDNLIPLTTNFRLRENQFKFDNLLPGIYRLEVVGDVKYIFDSSFKVFNKTFFITVAAKIKWKNIQNSLTDNDRFIVGSNSSNNSNLGIGVSKNKLVDNQKSYFVDFKVAVGSTPTNSDGTSYPVNLTYNTPYRVQVLFSSSDFFDLNQSKLTFTKGFMYAEITEHQYDSPFSQNSSQSSGSVISNLSFGTYSGPFDSSKEYRLLYKQLENKLELYVFNNNSFEFLHSIDDAYSTPRERIEVTSNQHAVGVQFASSNIDCVIPNIYAKLERKLTGVQYPVMKGRVYFSYQEEYSGSRPLNYKIYNSKNDVVSSSGSSPISISLGDNRYELVVNLLSEGTYILEVINEKNEKFYLRFRK